jgi:hypothetical protein
MTNYFPGCVVRIVNECSITTWRLHIADLVDWPGRTPPDPSQAYEAECLEWRKSDGLLEEIGFNYRMLTTYNTLATQNAYVVPGDEEVWG